MDAIFKDMLDKMFEWILHSYIAAICIIVIAIYNLVDSIKNPIPNENNSPLQGNRNGIAFGIGGIIYGLTIIIAKLFYGW